jgi:hypothetical protein
VGVRADPRRLAKLPSARERIHCRSPPVQSFSHQERSGICWIRQPGSDTQGACRGSGMRPLEGNEVSSPCRWTLGIGKEAPWKTRSGNSTPARSASS